MNQHRTLFGTDGIRGHANQDSMTPEIAFRLGAAVTHQARKRVKHPPRVVIGKDTRISGYLFETAIASGVCTMGGRVMLCGPLPTPAIAHLTQSMRADAGIVISASHNPYQDNGIKVFGPDGFKLPDAEEMDLEALIHGTELDTKRPVGMHVGRAERLEDARGRYVAFVKSTFPSDMTLEGVRIVVDAAHGAAYRTAPSIFSELGATVDAIGVKPNGKNINDRCGALHPEHVAKEVLKRKADIGIALDGDADRVILIDEQGKAIDGDAVMALCAAHMIRHNKLKHNTLVATVMSNLGLERAVQKHGGRLVRCAVGDRYVVEAMRNGGYNLGGEQSGHLIFLDYATTGDGLIAALQMLAIFLQANRPLSELSAEAMQRVPQILLNVTLSSRQPIESLPKTSKAIDSVNLKLGADGRVLVRWSGTEPKLRIMIEGPDSSDIQRFANEIADQVRAECGGSPRL
jgi:phosphoglucosamine mutase